MALESFQPEPARSENLPDHKEWSELSTAERKKLVAETISELSEQFADAGGVGFTNVNEMYRALPDRQYLVRRDDPERLAESLSRKRPLEIRFEGGTPYANAAAWSGGTKGIENAFIEGYSHKNNVVAVMGFEPDEKKMHVIVPKDSLRTYGELDRGLVRSVSGELAPEDVSFVTLRAPIQYFPMTQMTEEEKDSFYEYLDTLEAGKTAKPHFIYRGFLFSKPRNVQ